MLVTPLILLVSALSVGADPESLVGHAVPIASIDPAHDDFADLEPLKALIGDSRVVVLGEQSHGDGAVFLCKARFIGFLHQEMGFDVLAWEGGMLDCLAANETMKQDGIGPVEAATGVFPIWSMSAQVGPTLDYMLASQSTDAPIETVGFDAQITSQSHDEILRTALTALFEGIEPNPLTDEHLDVFDSFAQLRLGMPDEATLDSLSDDLRSLSAIVAEHRDALTGAGRSRDAAFLERVLDNDALFIELMKFLSSGADPMDNINLLNKRDEHMGANLVYLADDYYPDRKIIVWAATRHMVHRQKEISPPSDPGMYAEMDSAGETAFAELGDDLYTIGFTAGRGEAGNVFRDEAMTIEPPIDGSIEAACAEFGSPFLFVDFRSVGVDHQLRTPQAMRPLGYMWADAVWPDQMDAVVYIDEMFKSTREGLAPDGYVLTVED